MSPDVAIDVEESLSRFEGRTSTSSPGRVWSAAMSEEVDKSASGRSDHLAAIDFGSLGLTCDDRQSCPPVRDQSPKCAQETVLSLSKRYPLLRMKRIPSSSKVVTSPPQHGSK